MGPGVGVTVGTVVATGLGIRVAVGAGVGAKVAVGNSVGVGTVSGVSVGSGIGLEVESDVVPWQAMVRMTMAARAGMMAFQACDPILTSAPIQPVSPRAGKRPGG